MSASDARERQVLDTLFGSGTPTTWYWGLSTTQPNDDGSGFTEPVGGAYARVAYTNNTTNFPAATTTSGRTVKRNGTKVTWPNPTGTWGVIGWFGLFTASSGGTPDFTNPLDSTIAPKAGNTPVEFDVGMAELEAD